MALVIFSDRFSESAWCLKELARINDRLRERNLMVIPVFYRVSTDDVKNFRGNFGNCFTQTLQNLSPEEEHLAERWRSSVTSISSRTGFTSEVHRIDSDLVDAIVQEAKRQLPHSSYQKELPIVAELFCALVLAYLCNFVAPFVFNDLTKHRPTTKPMTPPPPPPPPPRPRRRPRPQLFVSFRGQELRNGFVSHVVKALRDAGVNVFIDSYEQKGRDLEYLLNRIDNSKMALVIFSDRFSESEWCLKELARMNDCSNEKKLLVIPVFYRVSTDDVKTFRGNFGNCFRKTMQRLSREERHLAERWISSVKSISSKTGFTSEVHRMDSDLVDAIVQEVKSQLPHISNQEKELPIETELFYALVFAFLCNFIAPFVFNDVSFYHKPQWFVGVLFWVLVRRVI